MLQYSLFERELQFLLMDFIFHFANGIQICPVCLVHLTAQLLYHSNRGTLADGDTEDGTDASANLISPVPFLNTCSIWST